MRLLIVGCGYVGSEVVRTCGPEWQIYALTRSEARSDELQSQGIQPVVGSWLDGDSLRDLPEVEGVLVSVPHRADGDYHEETHRVGLENLLSALPGGYRNLVYLSTTGVYGDCDSERVDEQTPVSPTRLGPQIAIEAEQALLDRFANQAEGSGGLRFSGNESRGATGIRCTILRLAGIYGPGRIPLASKILAGEPLAVPLEGFLNLAHVTDIARMISLVITRELQHNLYVFSDGHPVGRATFYRELARLCGVDEPIFAEPDANDSRSRRATSKRIDPSRLVRETEFRFRFPDYRAGLRQAIRETT